MDNCPLDSPSLALGSLPRPLFVVLLRHPSLPPLPRRGPLRDDAHPLRAMGRSAPGSCIAGSRASDPPRRRGRGRGISLSRARRGKAGPGGDPEREGGHTSPASVGRERGDHTHRFLDERRASHCPIHGGAMGQKEGNATWFLGRFRTIPPIPGRFWQTRGPSRPLRGDSNEFGDPPANFGCESERFRPPPADFARPRIDF